jgi:hypothetical protein
MKRHIHKTKALKKSRKARICDICEKAIRKGDKYGMTSRGTTYCEKCG